MTEGLEVIIKYRGAKYNQVASPATTSSEFAILKKDLAHLRVHSPSQKNVRRVNGSFILHWPTAGTSPKVEGLADSLHTRWFKLCSDDPEALKLREFLSMYAFSVRSTRGSDRETLLAGTLIRSTARPEQASQDAPPGLFADRLSVEIAQQPVSVPVPTYSSPVKPQPPAPTPALPPPPKLPPSAPRLDRQPPHLKRRLSPVEGPSSLTRQKLDAPEVQNAISSRSINTQLQHPPTSPRANRKRGSSTPGDATKAFPQIMRDDVKPLTHTHMAPPLPPEPRTTSPSPPREPGEVTPHTPLAFPAPVSGPSSSNSGLRPPPPSRPTLSTPRPASPYPSSPSSGGGDPHASRLRDRDVSRLMRELWDTRRQLTAMQAREQVILDDLERLGARPDSAGTGADRNAVSRDGALSRSPLSRARDLMLAELSRLEAELKTEKTKRARAERALDDVERECRAPFVVPALFQAFVNISELSS
ncbi:hypothetical protein J3R83DRAFT_3137 [Lanmaoa asiatica]|nr:hypothetical protein J3R83DRAFT_3137 [Lanmaoa asiatica]